MTGDQRLCHKTFKDSAFFRSSTLSTAAGRYFFIFSVMFKTKSGALKEEFWEDKSSGDDALVKMGDIDNFQSLLGSLDRPKRKPLHLPSLLPQARAKVVGVDPTSW